jgi:putative PIN family toxin of toxin-antitoxin system
MSTPLAVLDTNVLLDLWVFDDPSAHTLRAALDHGACIALRSADTDSELADVLARTEFELTMKRQQELLARWRERTRLIERVFPAPWRCADPRDQRFLDLAFTARAQLLVTRDKALLRLARKARAGGLRIAAPRDHALSVPASA